MTCPVMESRIRSTGRDSLRFRDSPLSERRYPRAFWLRDGAFGRVDRPKPQIGWSFDSDWLWPLPRRPHSAARLYIEGEPPRPRLAEFLSRRHSDRLWRFRRFLSGGSGLGQR